ncbi:basic salivary proline-rich protein 1-like isoform X2 [Branchiostoma lanceolatum]|uniref:basic salivary proline-rich protein 1-like isoform X2 n=1 Tax=Branchiostoma lanceolatum TaxID=7740 RepID=UPI0034511561
MSGHKINPSSSPTPLHGIEREGHIDEAAARRISVARLSINADVEQKLEEVMTRVRRKNHDKDDKTRWGSLRRQFREHGSTGFSPKLTEENSFELEHATNDKYQYHPGGKPRQTSPNHDADSGYNEERASPRYHTPDAQPVPKPATPVKKSEPPVVNATLEQLRRGSLFRGEKPITEKPHNAWQGLLARHQERGGRPGKHVTIKAGKPDEVEPPPRAPREAHRGPSERPPDRQTDGPGQGPHPARRSPPHGRRPSPNRRPGSPGGRSRSPNRSVVSPRGRRPSPDRQPGSPTGRRRSPNRPGSPAGRRRSPNRPSGSPDRRRRSPNRAGSPRRGHWPAPRKLAGSPRGRRWPSPPRQGDGSRGRSRSPNLARGPPNQRGRSPNARTGYPNEIYDSPGQRRQQPRDEELSSAERRRQSMPEGKNNDQHGPEDKQRRQSIPSHGNNVNRPQDKRNPNSTAEVWKADHPGEKMDDGRLIRSPPTSRPASSERRITPVEEVEPTVSSPTGLISAMKPTDGRRRPTPNKDNRPPSSKDPIQPVLHQPAKDPGPFPSTSAAFLGNPPEYGKENMPPKAKSPIPPSAKSPVPPLVIAKSPVPPSAKSPTSPKVKSPVGPNAPQLTRAPQPMPSTSGGQNNHATKPGQVIHG